MVHDIYVLCGIMLQPLTFIYKVQKPGANSIADWQKSELKDPECDISASLITPAQLTIKL